MQTYKVKIDTTHNGKMYMPAGEYVSKDDFREIEEKYKLALGDLVKDSIKIKAIEDSTRQLVGLYSDTIRDLLDEIKAAEEERDNANRIVEGYQHTADFITKMLHEAEAERDTLRAELAEVMDRHDWQCGCGHWNGPNLNVCAQCGRKPGER